MELKEVIHFYLGAKVEYEFTSRTSNKEIRNGKMYGMWDNFIRISTHWGSTEAPISSVKPILRKLDSMTEEDVKYLIVWDNFPERIILSFILEKECATIYYKWKSDMGLKDGFAYSSSAIYYDKEEWTPHQFQYLLSKGFDLFNLIKSGSAINASALTQNK